jgi:hypothetical protein
MEIKQNILNAVFEWLTPTLQHRKAVKRRITSWLPKEELEESFYKTLGWNAVCAV